MSDIRTFVEAVYNCFEASFLDIEEDQQLPPKETLEEVCRVLLNASCLREEGRFSNFRVCFIHPESEFLDAYLYAHVLLFKTPIPFNTRELHKLAPALNADMSYLMLDIRKTPIQAVGILASYTTWQKIITKELSSGNRMPRIPNILVNGPGELQACFGEANFVSYCSGRCVFFRVNTFTSTLVADHLDKDSNVSEKKRLQLLYRILWRVSRLGHGAAILIVPPESEYKEYLDLKYPLSSRFLFADDEKQTGTAWEKEIVTYADLIAKLTSVDGSVVLTRDYDLLGFGAEILVDRMNGVQPDMCFIGYNDVEDRNKHFKDQGMRHRSGYRFCNAVEGSVAFIISQDGMIEACTKHDGRVVVYDNIALPLL